MGPERNTWLQNARKNCSKEKYLAPVAANSYSTLERFHPAIPSTSAGRAMRRGGASD
jgi:hypothetical protein